MIGLLWASCAVAAAPEVAEGPVSGDRYPERAVPFPGGVRGHPDLVYATVPGFRPLTLDLYLPPSSRRAPEEGYPLVVHVHGGGWSGGDARHAGAFADFPEVLASLAARGYVVASVSYRLSGEAPFPAAAQDVRSAIRWLRSESDRYALDPSRAVIWGGSAGGQLAALIATACGVPPDHSDCVQGAVSWYGVLDFAALAGPAWEPARAYLRCDPVGCEPAVVAEASPITWVDAGDPPMLLIHGTGDALVPSSQSERMAAALRAAGAPVELLLLPDVGHGWVGPTPERTRAASLAALDATFRFIDCTVAAGSRAAAEASARR